eukprot:TRINITY_DN5385_c0_g1_i12.p2 TRINITY_DN5385_c0_g1~~TRINITY_DN5385_c0_g1_i12.p2  ORF type:complete len:170 (+),score=46.09 TRINITY_DN5385_c0_g1_i12:715-1224(+)
MKENAFKFLLAGGQKSAMGKMSEFSRILEWFGPLTIPEDGLLVRLESQLAKRSFHGPIESTDAQALLRDQEEGSYLIRFSGSVPGTYTISIKDGGKVVHFRLLHKPGGKYYMGTQDDGEDTLEALLVKMASYIPFRKPVGGSLYSELFSEFEQNNRGYVTVSHYFFDQQ